jgi:hypothetical protein
MIQTDRFGIYAWGLVFMSVCAVDDMSIEEIEDHANSERPTGLSHGWSLHDEPFKSGATNPHPCELYPKTHKHYLLSC